MYTVELSLNLFVYMSTCHFKRHIFVFFLCFVLFLYHYATLKAVIFIFFFYITAILKSIILSVGIISCQLLDGQVDVAEQQLEFLKEVSFYSYLQVMSCDHMSVIVLAKLDMQS